MHDNLTAQGNSRSNNRGHAQMSLLSATQAQQDYENTFIPGGHAYQRN
jgi:hypothetical protein